MSLMYVIEKIAGFLVEKCIVRIWLSIRQSFRNCMICFIFLVVLIALNVYNHFQLTEVKKSLPHYEYERDVAQRKITKKIKEMLIACGDKSYGLQLSIKHPLKEGEKGKILFKEVFVCDKEKANLLNDSDNCVVDHSLSNSMYLEELELDQSTLNFINNDTYLKNGSYFSDESVGWIKIYNKDGSLTDEAYFIKLQAPAFWKILTKTKIPVRQIGAVKYKQNNKVKYIFTLSFTKDSVRSCSLFANGRQEGDYLLNIKRTTENAL